jgi:hypothetical protein
VVLSYLVNNFVGFSQPNNFGTLLLRLCWVTLSLNPTDNYLKMQKNREKFYFQVLTKDLKYVILILIRKNYLKLFMVGCVSDSVTHHFKSLTSSENPHLHPVHPFILDILILTKLTKDFKYVIIILIRKNYLKLGDR